ncbi:hypothetical protein FRC09_014967 [Ceratobasidium sp. 395]|nr:hypothetical protein FRC09_014967 [Ceratobasidium sp. 395]
MAAYRNPRSFQSARRTHGTASPSKCCYPYTPASPQPTRAQTAVEHHQLAIMPLHHQAPLFPNSTPVTRSLPENPRSDLALPSLEHLANALHALASDGSSRNRLAPATDRRGRLPSCERRSSHRRKSRVSSQSRDRRPGTSTRDHHHNSQHAEPEQWAVVHVPASTWAFEPAPPTTTTKKSTPTSTRKLHYVPATPSTLYASPPASLKHLSPGPQAKGTLPTPPLTRASSSPRQVPLPSSPPKRHYTPHAPVPAPVKTVEAPVIQLLCPTPPPVETVSKSKFTRLVLAGRETAADDAAIEALMSSFDRIVDSLDGNDNDDDD